MSDDTPEVSELDALKVEAKALDIKFNPTIGIPKLQAKVDAAKEAAQELQDLASDLAVDPKGTDIDLTKDDVTAKSDGIARSAVEVAAALPKITAKELFIKRKRKAGELVRINVSCMNPNKKDWEGETISIGSTRLGTFKKYVLFNTDDGYHVPHIIYQAMKERKCQVFVTIKDNRGNKSRQGKLINEFAIEVLPNLNKEQLAELASRQALAGSID